MLISFVISGRAYEVLPEYRSLSRQDVTEWTASDSFDSETSSDELTYSFFPENLFYFHSNPVAAAVGLGSISGKQFQVNQHVKMRRPFGEKAYFQWTWNQQKNYHERFQNYFIEVGWSFVKDWDVAIYGQPDYEKKQDDIGLAVSHTLSPHHKVRAFGVWSDFTRNGRNEADDRLQTPPLNAGIVGRWLKSEKQFLEYAWRWEKKFKWSFPADNREYERKAQLFQLRFRQPINSTTLLFSTSYFKEEHAQERLSDGQLLSSQVSEKLKSLVEWEVPILLNKKIKLALQHVHRHFEMLSGQVRHRDWLPHIWLMPRKDQLGSQWAYGLESTFHRGEGPSSLRSNLDSDWAVEHRGNLRWTYRFSKSSHFSLLFTVDLDRFGTGETWEGGAGQMVARF